MSSSDYYYEDDYWNANMTDEQMLLSSIMRGYDRYTRPVYNASSTVNVKLGMTLVTIFDFVSTTSLHSYRFFL